MSRHWQRLTDLTGHKFEVEAANFSLRNIMEAPLLKNKEDIEVLCRQNIPFNITIMVLDCMHKKAQGSQYLIKNVWVPGCVYQRR